ncbi:hypothetical protein N9903_00880 [bacterium]|nr:hypothetical protein [bacterium]
MDADGDIHVPSLGNVSQDRMSPGERFFFAGGLGGVTGLTELSEGLVEEGAVAVVMGVVTGHAGHVLSFSCPEVFSIDGILTKLFEIVSMTQRVKGRGAGVDIRDYDGYPVMTGEALQARAVVLSENGGDRSEKVLPSFRHGKVTGNAGTVFGGFLECVIPLSYEVMGGASDPRSGGRDGRDHERGDGGRLEDDTGTVRTHREGP